MRLSVVLISLAATSSVVSARLPNEHVLDIATGSRTSGPTLSGCSDIYREDVETARLNVWWKQINDLSEFVWNTIGAPGSLNGGPNAQNRQGTREYTWRLIKALYGIVSSPWGNEQADQNHAFAIRLQRLRSESLIL